MVEKAKLENSSSLRRYTSLASAINILKTGQITLLDPARWDDANDAHFMAEFKRMRGMQTVLAACFAESAETYHHWRVFSPGPDGVCIEFDKAALTKGMSTQSGVTQRRVDYMTLRGMRERQALTVDELPFLKRSPYKPECEYRFVYVDDHATLAAKNFDIDRSWIRRITLSPWMPDAIKPAVKDTLNSISSETKVKIARSTLIGNDEWKSFTNKAK